MVSDYNLADNPGVPKTVRLALGLMTATVSLSACVSTRHLAAPAPLPSQQVPQLSQPAPVPPSAGAPAVVDFARSLIGTPYRYGGTSPDAGFDCSGFVAYVMSVQDIGMPRTVAEQYRVGASVRWDRLRDGDLVFFTTTGPGATHVGIIVNAAQQQFVHAPTDGALVRVDSLESDYWRRRWIGTRRVL